ncbi:glycerol kinase [Sphaerisporangium rufum]|uniref:ATP:glycerol 3-phosphotransferase n=1 Tax=Sphaerisporangium rufum TaxID=1381558 RepID=A0A919V314_9ACTN|nr:FGGY family carbohydrate kinase [Sphaerisporangium rufum]GII81269.1 glycerol kinase [Sphaerisporangium rufum]
MPDPLVLAIDQGTSATKCLLVDAAGRIVARAATPVAVDYPQRNRVEQSPMEIWASVRDAVARCVSGHDPADIAAVGVSNQRESVLLWDRATGLPLGPMLGWQDQRTADACRRLRAAGAGEAVRRISGLPLDPMFSALKARWLLDTYDPDRRRAARGELCLGTVDSWLIWRLTGEHRVEMGNAARTQLLDVRRRAWSEELLELFDVPPEVLPAPVPSSGPFGEVRDLAGLPASVPLAGVLGDSHAALLAHGAVTPGLVKATYGTGSSVIGVLDVPGAVPDGLCLTIAWDEGTPVYAVEGNIRASGAVLAWLARLLRTTPAELAAMAENASSAGVDIVPAFGGLGAPWWDEHATGLISGLDLGTAPEQLARAAIEAIALQVNDVVAAVAQGAGPVRRLLADGGGSANDTLMQLQADFGRIPVWRAVTPNLSALGAAHLAGRTAGVWSRADLGELPREYDTFTPCADGAGPAERVASWHTAVDRARLRLPKDASG